jgi:hypothetical protein
MAKRRAKAGKPKSKPAKKVAAKKAAPAKAATPAGASHLHRVIEELIAAKQRGDHAAGEKAVSALKALRKGHAAAPVRQAAAEACAVADNPVLMESTRMLGNIAARVRAHA